MTLYIDLRVNDEVIDTIEVTRERDTNGTDPDAVNCYRYSSSKGFRGGVFHRYGDGASGLASRVLAELVADAREASRSGGAR